MKRVYKNNDIRFNLTLNSIKINLDMVSRIEFKFYTINNSNCIIKTKSDITNNSLVLEWNELKNLEQGVLYYDYRVSVCDTDLEDGTFDTVTNNTSDYYIMSGKSEVQLETEFIEWGNIAGDLEKQTDIVDYINSHDKTYVDDLNLKISKKQDTLVSGENIMTINNKSLLQKGNLNVVRSRKINSIKDLYK